MWAHLSLPLCAQDVTGSQLHSWPSFTTADFGTSAPNSLAPSPMDRSPATSPPRSPLRGTRRVASPLSGVREEVEEEGEHEHGHQRSRRGSPSSGARPPPVPPGSSVSFWPDPSSLLPPSSGGGGGDTALARCGSAPVPAPSRDAPPPSSSDLHRSGSVPYGLSGRPYSSGDMLLGEPRGARGAGLGYDAVLLRMVAGLPADARYALRPHTSGAGVGLGVGKGGGG